MNYDVKLRDQIEDVILGTIISYHEHEYNFKQVLFKHGVDDPLYFRTKLNQDIFSTILECWRLSYPTDLINIVNMRPANYRKTNDITFYGDFDYNITIIMNKSNFPSNMERYLLMLKEYVLMDYWNNKANDILSNFWDNRDILIVSDNLIDGYNQLLNKFTQNLRITTTKDIEQQAIEMRKQIQEGKNISIKTGLYEFDKMSGGWQNSELNIVGARTGMGKTSFMIAMALNSSFQFRKRGLFISLEMTRNQLINRITASQTGINYQDIKNYRTSDEDFQKVLEYYRVFNNQNLLTIIDTSEAKTFKEIENAILKYKPEYVIIDYLQLVKAESKSIAREQQVAEISRNLKLCATEFKIPIIALAQVGRGVEKQIPEKRRPKLSDLRESGAIEQDADVVIFLYREAYYKELEGEFVSDTERGNTEFTIAKGREIGSGTIHCHLDFKTSKIESNFKFNGVGV